jgi:two-component system chemotaxis sensor kinase CheA
VIKVDFKKEGDRFFIDFFDDGAGIDPEKVKKKVLEIGLKEEKDLKDQDLISMIFLPGFSTKDEVTDISGRGVGMDAVREEVERLGGTIKVDSTLNQGTHFQIELPFIKS